MSPSALIVTTVSITLEAFLVPFADHFRAQGWRVDAAANDASSNPYITDHFESRFDIPWSRNPLDPRNLIGTSEKLRDIVKDGGYDVVHVHTPVAAFVTRYALRRLPRSQRPTIIYTAHGFHFYDDQKALPHVLFRTMEQTAARWTDFLVTINDEDYAAARSLGGIPSGHVRHIPGIGVDIDRFSPEAASASSIRMLREEISVPPDAFLLAMIAELSPVKRHGHLLEALARVVDERVFVAFVGTGPLESSLREKVFALGLGDRIRWLGYRRDIPVVLSASDALVLVSQREGLPRSVLEAMAVGKPIFGTRTRGITDAVGEEAGWIVDKNDPTELASVIDEAAADPHECARRGHAARERAVTRFALSDIITAYEELYREALTSRV